MLLTLASTKQPGTRSDSSSDSESDEDEFALAWQQTKERLEREEFLKVIIATTVVLYH